MKAFVIAMMLMMVSSLSFAESDSEYPVVPFKSMKTRAEVKAELVEWIKAGMPGNDSSQ